EALGGGGRRGHGKGKSGSGGKAHQRFAVHGRLPLEIWRAARSIRVNRGPDDHGSPPPRGRFTTESEKSGPPHERPDRLYGRPCPSPPSPPPRSTRPPPRKPRWPG